MGGREVFLGEGVGGRGSFIFGEGEGDREGVGERGPAICGLCYKILLDI